MKITKENLLEIIWKCYSDSYELVEFKGKNNLDTLDVDSADVFKAKQK